MIRTLLEPPGYQVVAEIFVSVRRSKCTPGHIGCCVLTGERRGALGQCQTVETLVGATRSVRDLVAVVVSGKKFTV